MPPQSNENGGDFNAEILGAIMSRANGTDNIDSHEKAAETARLKAEQLEPITKQIRRVEMEIEHLEQLVAINRTRLAELNNEYDEAESIFYKRQSAKAKEAEEAKMLRLAEAAEDAARHIRRSLTSSALTLSASSSATEAILDDARVVEHEAAESTFTSAFSSLDTHINEAAEAPIEFIVVDGLYTKPPCMQGVPVAKIVEGDKYWVKSWIRMDKWVPRGGSKKEISVEFFKRFEIHPNQLLSKEYYDSRGLCYDRLPIILRRIMEVLAHAKVTNPLQWLRNRLAQLIACQKGKFDLKETLFSFQMTDISYAKYYKEHRYTSVNKPRAEATAVQSKPPKRRVQSMSPKTSYDHPRKKMQTRSVGSPYNLIKEAGDRIVPVELRNSTFVPLSSLPSTDSQTSALYQPTKLDPILTNTPPSKPTFISEREDIFFELFFIRCGDYEWIVDRPGKTPFGMMFDAAAKCIRPFARKDNPKRDKDLSSTFPELVVSFHSVVELMFRTIREECDCVKLLRAPGLGPTARFGFNKTAHAINFAKLLCKLNNKIKLSKEHREHIEKNGIPADLPASSAVSPLAL